MKLFALSARVLGVSLALVFGACAPPPPRDLPSLKDEQAESGASPSSVGQLVPGEPMTPIAVETDDPSMGAPNAKVTIVAFLDYQCRFCAEGFRTLLSLRSEYDDKDLRIVFKHLPLESHELAVPAAIAAQAVMDGAGSASFFQFSRMVFEGQSQIGYDTLANWAEEAGLPRDMYNELVNREMTVLRVAEDARLAQRIGVEATPAFYVNGRLVAGAQSREYFQKTIFEELHAMNQLLEAPGSTWKSAYQARVSANMRVSVLSALLEKDPHDYRVPVDASPVLGNVDAPVTLVVFSDFECPFCKRAEATLAELRRRYPNELRIVFKHMPLGFHKHALPAAALAAAIQKERGDSAFYEAAHAIFERSPHLESAALVEIGEKYGLSRRQVEDAVAGNDAAVNERLRKDMELSDDVLARGAPHFFVNGKRLSGAQPIEQFEALILHGNKRAHELLAKGVAPNEVYQALQEGARSPGLPQKVTELVPSAGRPQKGAKDAPIVVHVFSDFECPYCRQGEGALEELMKTFEGKLRVVWHDFPLEFHERARPAARLGRLAYQKKGDAGFWQMHGLLFGMDRQEVSLSDEDLREYGKKLGLSPTDVTRAIETTSDDVAIDAEMEMASALGIRGTPAYLIGGYLVTGAKPPRYLERIVNLALSDLDAAASRDGGAGSKATTTSAK